MLGRHIERASNEQIGGPVPVRKKCNRVHVLVMEAIITLNTSHQFYRGNEREIIEHPSVGKQKVRPTRSWKDITLPSRCEDGRERTRSERALNEIEIFTVAHQFATQKKCGFVLEVGGSSEKCDFIRQKWLGHIKWNSGSAAKKAPCRGFEQ